MLDNTSDPNLTQNENWEIAFMNLGTKRKSNLSTVPIVSMFLTHTT